MNTSETITEFLDRLEALPVRDDNFNDRVSGISPEDRQRLYDLALRRLMTAGPVSDVIKSELTAWAKDIRARLPEIIAAELTK